MLQFHIYQIGKNKNLIITSVEQDIQHIYSADRSVNYVYFRKQLSIKTKVEQVYTL